MVIPELQFGSAKEAFEVVRNYIEARTPGKGPTVFDLVKPKSSEMYFALKFLVDNYFYYFSSLCELIVKYYFLVFFVVFLVFLTHIFEKVNFGR
jgi:hypothetical protein